ncbi:MAG: DUF22 domain-containing protein [Candidatus Thorarchaeota archaeon]
MVPVVADEKVAFTEGETNFVSIKPIPIPGNSVVMRSFYGTNGMGHLACIGSQDQGISVKGRSTWSNIGSSKEVIQFVSIVISSLDGMIPFIFDV